MKTHKDNTKTNTTHAFSQNTLRFQVPDTPDVLWVRCREVIESYTLCRHRENRNVRLFIAACAVREVRPGVSAEGVLCELSDGLCQYECEDFDREEIEKTVNSALRPTYQGFRFPREYLEKGGYLV